MTTPAPSKPTYRYSAIASDHPLATACGAVGTHRLVLFDKIGPEPQPCHWCSRPLDWFVRGARRLIVDHLDNDGCNNDPSNLVPCCMRCNAWRGRNPKEFAWFVEKQCPQEWDDRTPEDVWRSACAAVAGIDYSVAS